MSLGSLPTKTAAVKGPHPIPAMPETKQSASAGENGMRKTRASASQRFPWSRACALSRVGFPIRQPSLERLLAFA